MLTRKGKQSSRRNVKRAAGFTLAELAALIVVGAILSGLLVADLNQSRTTLLRQACAANLKQWGMAIYLYAQDYNGTYYYSFMASNFSDTDSPYFRYLGGNDRVATMRTMRVCPAVAARATQERIIGPNLYTYSMPVPMTRVAGAYRTAMPDNNAFLGFNLRTPPYPSQYLLLIDSDGHTLTCGRLMAAVTRTNLLTGDSISALDRHEGGVNCLFGDCHVEFVTSQTLSNQDTVSCTMGNPWFMMN